MSEHEVPHSGGSIAARRLAGAGGIAFALTVIAGAVVGGDIPPPDADAAEILDFAADATGPTAVAAVLFVLGGIGILPYVSMMWGRYRDGTAALLARVGTFGFLGVAAFFGASLATRVALVAAAPRLSDDSDVAVGLWSLENASMTINSLFLAIALTGLALAAVTDGLAPRWFRYAAPVGAATLLVGPLAAVTSTESGTTAVPGLVGLLIWLVFLVTTGAATARMHEGQASRSTRTPQPAT